MESTFVDDQPCEKVIIEILESKKKPITIWSLNKQVVKKDRMLEYEFRYALIALLARGIVKMVGNSRRLILYNKTRIL